LVRSRTKDKMVRKTLAFALRNLEPWNPEEITKERAHLATALGIVGVRIDLDQARNRIFHRLLLVGQPRRGVLNRGRHAEAA